MKNENEFIEWIKIKRDLFLNGIKNRSFGCEGKFVWESGRHHGDWYIERCRSGTKGNEVR